MGVAATWVLGPYPALTLADARIAAADARKLMAQGIDPLNARNALLISRRTDPGFPLRTDPA
jgi:Arm DNA-binding domain